LRAMLVATGLEQVATGLEQIEIQVRRESKSFSEGWMPGSEVGELVSSATIEAIKPRERKSSARSTRAWCCGPDCCTWAELASRLVGPGGAVVTW
jgi:hypothetical protein